MNKEQTRARITHLRMVLDFAKLDREGKKEVRTELESLISKLGAK